MRNESLQSLFGVCVGLLAKTTIGKAYAGLYRPVARGGGGGGGSGLVLYAQLKVKTERTQNSSLPLLFRPFPGLLPTELSKRMAEIDTLINAHHVQRAVDLSRRLIALCKEGMRYYHTYHRLPLKVAVTAGFVGWLACALAQQKVLGQHSNRFLIDSLLLIIAMECNYNVATVTSDHAAI